ncbi:unnamed protein product [Ectocarpus sp. CCAP 1310/34]|nr:unnamed protein product [Ectocarpus sp. CCAP 1310/34]CAB1102405.1 unnamed protein product [Ectocarpus sp. CCAP 1310/34]CAB1102926.1 unnamed protein product [Ectocarpus sp. CCAP 1310/34]CAB1111028.1 unnamed protein product [Ectocarpus sp. CCAP 1310/34]
MVAQQTRYPGRGQHKKTRRAMRACHESITFGARVLSTHSPDRDKAYGVQEGDHVEPRNVLAESGGDLQCLPSPRRWCRSPPA